MRLCLLPRVSRAAALAGGLLLPALWSGCASAPPSPAATVVSFEQKMAWMLRLEDQRVLHDPPPPVVAPTPGKKRSILPTPPPTADLLPLLVDGEARVRRRAALAIGRVGLSDGVTPLAQALAQDEEAEVRQMAAFALGLIGDKAAVPALRTALGDASPLVRGRAAEALATLGDAESAPAIGHLATLYVGAAATVEGDDLAETHDAQVDAFRLAVLALGRLKAYEPLAAATLSSTGQPLVRWWPAAAAFQRTEDRRAAGPLTAYARGTSRLARGFAAKGLGALKDQSSVDLLVSLAQGWSTDPQTAASAVRALAQIGDGRAAPALVKLLQAKDLDLGLWLEVIAACGAVRAEAAVDPLLDLMTHRSPAVRAASLRALYAIDRQRFLIVLSGLDPDPDWSVRAALATLLGTYDGERSVPRLKAMLSDKDLRVIPAVLAALVAAHAPGADQVLFDWIKRDDAIVRMAAAEAIGTLKPSGGESVLQAAFKTAQADGTYVARAAALAALAKYGRDAVLPLAEQALSDKDFAVRLRAAAIVRQSDASRPALVAIRPAPTRHPAAFYSEPHLVAPSVSPHVYIDTDKGTVEIELGVLDAPVTCDSFVALASRGYFNGLVIHRVVPNFVVQDGDPRGDGEGGPGYTIRDEFNERPYLRGTVGMALDGPETGGSQFFITHSPQPHLDAKYTVFGTVVKGMEVVDRLQVGDVIRRVRVWDGQKMVGE